jgi:hypothetical protein
MNLRFFLAVALLALANACAGGKASEQPTPSRDCADTDEKMDNVFTKYDRFRNISSVALSDLQFGARIPMPGARGICFAQVRLELHATYPGTEPPAGGVPTRILFAGVGIRGGHLTDAVFLADQLRIRVPLEPSDASRNTFLGELTSIQLRKVSGASDVELSVGGLEVELTTLQRELLRRFAARLDHHP